MSNPKYSFILLLTIFVMGLDGKLKKSANPPHCTQVTKDTDYQSYFKLDYPVAYILPGQHEAYQKMYCLNPPTVHKAVTTVCDWAAPPQVQFTLGDDFVHVVRQDPTGRYLGEHVDGEEVSYVYNGAVPGFKPVYSLNVTSQKEELQPQFTFLRVEYHNLMSDVSITYDPETYNLTFYIQYPFFAMPIGVLGYSLPKTK